MLSSKGSAAEKRVVFNTAVGRPPEFTAELIIENRIPRNDRPVAVDNRNVAGEAGDGVL